jgi:hypothetical protein
VLNKEKYLSEIEHQYRLMCVALKAGTKISELEKGRFEGFIRAGLVIGVVTYDEMQELLEDVHFTVFKKSIAERKSDGNEWCPEGAIDFKFYDSPAYERMRRNAVLTKKS